MGQRSSRSIWNATQIDVTICETKEYVIEDAPKLPSFMDNCEFSSFYIALSNSSNKTNRLIISCGRFRNPSRSIRASQNENNQCTSWLNQYTTRINITKFDREVNIFFRPRQDPIIYGQFLAFLFFSWPFQTAVTKPTDHESISVVEDASVLCDYSKRLKVTYLHWIFTRKLFTFRLILTLQWKLRRTQYFRSRTFFFQFCHRTIVLCTKICDQFFPLDFVFPGEKRANQNFSLSQVSDKRKEHLSLKRWICYDNRMQ